MSFGVIESLYCRQIVRIVCILKFFLTILVVAELIIFHQTTKEISIDEVVRVKSIVFLIC